MAKERTWCAILSEANGWCPHKSDTYDISWWTWHNPQPFSSRITFVSLSSWLVLYHSYVDHKLLHEHMPLPFLLCSHPNSTIVSHLKFSYIRYLDERWISLLDFWWLSYLSLLHLLGIHACPNTTKCLKSKASDPL